MSEHVILKKSRNVMSIVLNRPEKMNALSSEMYELMAEGLIQATADESVRAVLFQASGDSFCAGNDLADFSLANQDAIELTDLPSVKFMKLLLKFEKPVVAAVKGVAVGIGATMLMHCDVVVAGRSTSFSLPFTKLGLVPEFGSTYILPKVAGRVLASEVLLLGRPFGIETAQQLGMVSTVCEDPEVDSVGLEKSLALAALPAQTLRDTKALIRANADRTDIEAIIDRELVVFTKALKSAEHRQALEVFFAKTGDNKS